MTEEKTQKFTAKVRRGLTWVDTVASAELMRLKTESGGGIAGMTAAQLSDLESALLWIQQNKEAQS